MHEGNPVLNIQNRGQWCIEVLVYLFLLKVPSFSSRYFNKIKRTSRLGRLLALSLEILSLYLNLVFYRMNAEMCSVRKDI